MNQFNLLLRFQNGVCHNKQETQQEGLSLMGNLEQQLNEAKAAPSHKNYSDRKRNAMLKLHAQPLYPRLAIVLLVCMLVLTCVLTIAETFHSRILELSVLLKNIATTGLGIWSLYAVPLILVCILGMRFNRKRFYQKQTESGTQSETDAEHQRDRRAIRRLNRTYIGYIALSLAGIFLWGILFLIAR